MKPAGMAVHPGPGTPDGTLVNALLAHCGDSLSGIGGVRRPGIVHRLDKDTSGLMVAAKTDLAHQGLAAEFARHDIERAYLAVVWGMPSPRSGEIEGAIGRHPTNRKKMAIVARGGKPALTRYKVVRPLGLGAAWSNAGWRPAAPTRSACIWPRSAIRCWAIRSMAGPTPARLALLSPAQQQAARAMRRQALHAYRLGSAIRGAGNNCVWQVDLPADIEMLDREFRICVKTFALQHATIV